MMVVLHLVFLWHFQENLMEMDTKFLMQKLNMMEEIRIVQIQVNIVVSLVIPVGLKYYV